MPEGEAVRSAWRTRFDSTSKQYESEPGQGSSLCGRFEAPPWACGAPGLNIPRSVFQEALPAPEQQRFPGRGAFPEPTQGQRELQLSSPGGSPRSEHPGGSEPQISSICSARSGAEPLSLSARCNRLLLEALRSIGSLVYYFFPFY